MLLQSQRSLHLNCHHQGKLILEVDYQYQIDLRYIYNIKLEHRKLTKKNLHALPKAKS